MQRNVTLTGSSAVAADRGTAGVFGLASSTADSVDGYVERGLLDSYLDEFHLASDHNGNVTPRATDMASRSQRIATKTAVALDLADSLDVRERSAGLRMLERTLRSA